MKVSLFRFGAVFLVGWSLQVARACNHHQHHVDEENPSSALVDRHLEGMTEDELEDYYFEDHDIFESDYWDNLDNCLATPTAEDIAQGVETMEAYAARRRALSNNKKKKGTPIVVPVVMHRIYYQPNLPFGATDEMVADQMDVLNTAFAPNFSFVLVNQTETYSATWFRFISINRQDLITEMKTALHQGGADTLNIYITRPRFQGIATFPQDVKKAPILDGIVVNVMTMPKGRLFPFNLGITTVHEVGHWLGLFHTFEGGCTEPNDFVKDTNPQSSPTEGCPEFRDSCVRPAPPGLKGTSNGSNSGSNSDSADPARNNNPGSVSPHDDGPDPFHNYMDYSTDACRDNFTPGQVDRMLAHWHRFREPRGNAEQESESLD